MFKQNQNLFETKKKPKIENLFLLADFHAPHSIDFNSVSVRDSIWKNIRFIIGFQLVRRRCLFNVQFYWAIVRMPERWILHKLFWCWSSVNSSEWKWKSKRRSEQKNRMNRNKNTTTSTIPNEAKRYLCAFGKTDLAIFIAFNFVTENECYFIRLEHLPHGSAFIVFIVFCTVLPPRCML